MSILGAALLSAAGLMGGLAAARSLREELRRCAELCRMLSLMEFELRRFCTPLPELFSALADALGGQAAQLCARAACALSEESGTFGDVWRGAVAPLPKPERELLAPLGGVLGRYGVEEQLAAVEEVLRAMCARRDRLETAAREKGRVYIGLCTAAGLMLAVVLL